MKVMTLRPLSAKLGGGGGAGGRNHVKVISV